MSTLAEPRRPDAMGLRPGLGPNAPRTSALVRAGDQPALLTGTAVLFLAMLSLMLVEYIGLGKDLPILKMARYSTLVAYGLALMMVVKVGPKALVEYAQSKVLLAFVMFTGMSVIYAVIRSYVPTYFRAHIDYFCLYLATVYLVDRARRLDLLSLTSAFITVVLVARNLSKLGEEQRTAFFTAGYFLVDGNDFSWGLVTLLPFSIFLMVGRRPLLYRLIGLAGLGSGLLGVMGTQSRGATLAVGAGGIFYWAFIAKRKAASAIALAVIVAGALLVAPSGYLNRMQTIDNYQEDSSAQGRIRAWKASVSMAIDYPLGVGAGSFNSAFGRFYMPADSQGWAPNRWISAHSVYFKVLGEYGFLGLGMIVWIIASCVLMNVRNMRRVRAAPSAYPIPDSWPALLALGMVSYAVSAVFLGGIDYPHLYFLAGLSVGCHRMLAIADVATTGDPAGTTRSPALPDRPSPAPAAMVPSGPQRPAALESAAKRSVFFD